jgi:hypothetical protein
MVECIELEFSDEYRCGYNDAVLEFKKRICKNCAWFDGEDCNMDSMMIVPKVINNSGCGLWEEKKDDR